MAGRFKSPILLAVGLSFLGLPAVSETVHGADDSKSPIIVRATDNSAMKVAPHQVIEWSFQSADEHADPTSIHLDALVVGPDENQLTVPAFWAGGNEWRFRFSSGAPGRYRFTTKLTGATDSKLHDQAGSITVIDQPTPHPLLEHGPLRLSDDKSHFIHDDGTPFFWLADSWWHGMTTRLDWPAGFKRLTQDRVDKGFSVIQFAIAFPCDIKPFDSRGANAAGHAWTDPYTAINPSYFDLVDRRVEHIVEQGLVPNVVGMWGYYLPFIGVEKAKQHWRYLVARYGAFPVTWTVCGESTLTWYLLDKGEEDTVRRQQVSGWSNVARYLKSIDPYQRLRTIHPGPGSGRFEPLTDTSTLDVIMLQPGHKDSSVAAAIGHRAEAIRRFPDQPVMIGEVCFEGMHGECKEKVQRMVFWGSILSGAPGHCYGADAIWQFNTLEQPFGKSPNGHIWGNTPWEVAYQWPGATHVGIGRKILARFDWHRLKPDSDSVQPAATEDKPRGAFLARIGDELRIVYLPDGVAPWNRKTVVSGLTPGKTYLARYIDPLTGDTYPEMKFVPEPNEQSSTGTWRLPAAPILQDWLLVIETSESQ